MTRHNTGINGDCYRYRALSFIATWFPDFVSYRHHCSKHHFLPLHLKVHLKQQTLKFVCCSRYLGAVPFHSYRVSFFSNGVSSRVKKYIKVNKHFNFYSLLPFLNNWNFHLVFNYFFFLIFIYLLTYFQYLIMIMFRDSATKLSAYN
jgi:hypothetical protein